MVRTGVDVFSGETASNVFVKMDTAEKRVHAFVRVKPTADFAQDMIKFGRDNKSIDIYIKKDAKKGVVNNRRTDWSFRLDGVLHNASQDLAYETVAEKLVSEALNGYNGTIMCYGQTGAGKTYTMTGATADYKHRGIIPRAIQQVLKATTRCVDRFVTVRVSYLEIYNETLFDLLSTMTSSRTGDAQMAVVDCPQGVYVKGLSIHTVSHEEDALNLLFEGETNRVIAEHALNKNSSRSHCIFTIYIESRFRVFSDVKHVTSKINLIDLAGSERLSKTGLSSLRFATRMKWITTEPVINETCDAEWMVKTLEKEIVFLKRELAMHDSLVNRSLVTYDPLTEIQIADIKSQVQKYLEGSIDEIDIVNIRQVQEVFKQFKLLVSQQEQEVEARLRSKYALIDKNDFAAVAAAQKAGLVDVDGLVVGEMDGQDSGTEAAPFSSKHGGKKTKPRKTKEQGTKEGIGTSLSGKELDALLQSKSQVMNSTKDLDVKEGARNQDAANIDAQPSQAAPMRDSQKPSSPPPKPVAFEQFKKECGSELNRIFKENKSILLARKKRSSTVEQRLNLIKHEMEGIKEALGAQRQERWQQGEYVDEKGQIIIDEEEFLLIMKLKDLKKEYRSDYAELQDLKAEIQYCQHLVDQCRNKLVSEFEIWYNESFLIPKDVQDTLKPGGNIRPGMIPINRVMCLEEDAQDRFERMQKETLPACPDSVSFYNAKMKADQKHAYARTMSSLEQMRKKPGLLTAATKNKPLWFLHIS
ncbi:kinesin-like protein KIF9 isoform X9 [Apteryx rowi]|uniref:kinesin-like protein KIF9 isoform X9 n=1 Tax=Apteryx rowi TaxID=308060 RepID=UPI000E1DCE9C|nr:kinesin-like protein KIF9 isoform X9 [Apteryx rowi]